MHMVQMVNPANEKRLEPWESHDENAVQGFVQAAVEAQKDWAAQDWNYRLSRLSRFGKLLTQESSRLAALLTQETGKPLSQARGEIEGVQSRLHFFLEETQKWSALEVMYEGSRSQEEITWEPMGVVANISAWNYPYFVGCNVLIPALLTGNAVMYKPSEYATQTGSALVHLLHQAGVPTPLIQCVRGGGAVARSLLSQDIHGVFFTGSLATGTKIAQQMAARMVPVQLELGGKDALYICDDVDVEVAAKAAADGAFYNTGQSCCSVERIYVHNSIIKEFVAKMRDVVNAYVMGDPMQSNTFIGPLTRGAQIEVLEKQVADAVGQGAVLECGGKALAGEGYYFEPTILSDVTHDMLVMREETFGPMIGVQAVADDAEAQELMNDTEYGLTAGVYTRDEQRARAILARINTGSVYWNCCDRVSPRLPWSGRKHSGQGSTLSYLGIRAFLRPKAWHLKAWND
jgi:acyl-CoA reductase-like NAD-dependent aldehyde dehydrogenase